MHDQGTVTAPAVLGTPTGSVDFKFYKGDDCAAGEVTADLLPMCKSGAPATSCSTRTVLPIRRRTLVPLGAGSYYFTAHFKTGNENVWSDSDSTCEPLTVEKAQLTIVTQIHNAATATSVTHACPARFGRARHGDRERPRAGFNPTGAVTFTLDSDLVARSTRPSGLHGTTVGLRIRLGRAATPTGRACDGNANYIGDRERP